MWGLYHEGTPPRRMWNQIGTDLTLFCGLRQVASSQARKSSRRAPIYLSIFTYAVPFLYLGMMDAQGAIEGVDIWLTWGPGSAPAEMRAADGWNDEAIRVGKGFRAFLVDFARTGTLGGAWQAFPAVCEYGTELVCSEQNVHAQACAVFDEAVGRKFDLELGR